MKIVGVTTLRGTTHRAEKGSNVTIEKVYDNGKSYYKVTTEFTERYIPFHAVESIDIARA